MRDNHFIRPQFVKFFFCFIRFEYEILHIYYCNHLEQKIIQHFIGLKVVYMVKKIITNGKFQKVKAKIFKMKHDWGKAKLTL